MQDSKKSFMYQLNEAIHPGSKKRRRRISFIEQASEDSNKLVDQLESTINLINAAAGFVNFQLTKGMVNLYIAQKAH